MRWNQITSGDVIKVPAKKWVIACCDCGLVHTLEFKGADAKTDKIFVKVTMKPGLTRERRKARGKKLKMVPK